MGFYKIFSKMVEKWVNNDLSEQMHLTLFEVQNQYIKSGSLYIGVTNRTQITQVTYVPGNNFSFRDTIIYNQFEQLYLPYRAIDYFTKVDTIPVKITIHKSLIGTNTLIENIVVGTTALSIIFLISIYILNRYIFKQIWGDFFNALHIIKHFDLNSDNLPEFTPSMIIEFNQLNAVLKKMIHKIQTDYNALKQFTANINHELQTPLAIIKSKIELMLQSEITNQDQLKLIEDIYKGTIRLSKINQGLILLTKIENNLFISAVPIHMNAVIIHHLEFFQSLTESKQIAIETNLMSDIYCVMSPELADILVVNLLKNAISHNLVGGRIIIDIQQSTLSISNTGEPLAINPESLFNRFAKNQYNKNSTGLGLAIVKKICDTHHIKISYSGTDTFHIFSLYFSN